MHPFAPTIHRPLPLMVTLVKCLPWWLTFSRWWRTRNVVMWLLPGRMMGFFSFRARSECLIRPPTQCNPRSSTIGFNLIRGLCWERSCFVKIHLSLSAEASSYTLLMTNSSASSSSLQPIAVLQMCHTAQVVSFAELVKQCAICFRWATALVTESHVEKRSHCFEHKWVSEMCVEKIFTSVNRDSDALNTVIEINIEAPWLVMNISKEPLAVCVEADWVKGVVNLFSYYFCYLNSQHCRTQLQMWNSESWLRCKSCFTKDKSHFCSSIRAHDFKVSNSTYSFLRRIRDDMQLILALQNAPIE